jgi:O-antigen/teichoic acid export membrane protein
MIKKLTILAQRVSPNLRQILSNASWLVTDKILRMAIGLLVGVWTARYLGAENFGIYNYAIAFTTLFTAISGLGLNPIAVREIVQYPQDKEKLLGTTFALKLLGGITTSILAITLIYFVRSNDTLVHSLVAIGTVGEIFLAFDTIDFWFQSQTQSRYSVAAKGMAFVTVNILKIILIQIRAPVIVFSGVLVLEIILSAIGLILVYRKTGNSMRLWKYDHQLAARLLRDSWTLILSGLVIMIYMRSDQLMIGQMIGDQAVGIYSVAARLSEIWYFIPAAIVTSVYPSIIAAKKISEELYYNRVQQLLHCMSLLSYFIAIAVSIFAHQLVQIFGSEYQSAVPVLIVHIWTILFVSSGLVRSLWTTTEGLMKFAFVTTCMGAILNVFLNLLLIKTHGILGAAVATLISQAVASLISNVLFPQTRHMFFYQFRAVLLPNPYIAFKINHNVRQVDVH